MNDLNQKLDKVELLLNFINVNDTFQNFDDIRSFSIHSIAQITQSYLFALYLNKELENLNYVKNNISKEINIENLPTINYIYDGFIKNAFFLNSFVYVENHIRKIALHFERTQKDINVISITTTFRNLRDSNKINYFINLDKNDEDLFTFYCYLRNTMHNVGTQTESDKSLFIFDANSIFTTKKTELKLVKDLKNDLTFDNLLLLKEQIIKLLLKINCLIPKK